MEWRPRTRRALAGPPLAPPSVPCSPCSREDSGPEQRGGGTRSARAASLPRCFRNRPRAGITCARPSLRSRSWSRVRALRPSSPPRLPSPAAAPTYAAQPLGEVAPAGALGSPVQPARPVQNRLLQGQGAPHSPDARGGHGQEADATDDDDSRGPAALLAAPWHGSPACRPWARGAPGEPALAPRPARARKPHPTLGGERTLLAGYRASVLITPQHIHGGVPRAPQPPETPEVGTRAQSGIPKWSDAGKRLLALGKGKSWRGEPLYLEPKGVGEHKEGELPRTDRTAGAESQPRPSAPSAAPKRSLSVEAQIQAQGTRDRPGPAGLPGRGRAAGQGRAGPHPTMAGRSCHGLPAQVGDFEPAQDKASSVNGSKLGATFVARAQDCPSMRGIWLGAQVTVTCPPVQGLRGQGRPSRPSPAVGTKKGGAGNSGAGWRRRRQGPAPAPRPARGSAGPPGLTWLLQGPPAPPAPVPHGGQGEDVAHDHQGGEEAVRGVHGSAAAGPASPPARGSDSAGAGAARPGEARRGRVPHAGPPRSRPGAATRPRSCPGSGVRSRLAGALTPAAPATPRGGAKHSPPKPRPERPAPQLSAGPPRATRQGLQPPKDTRTAP